MSETLVSVRPSPVYAVRWPAVAAGMTVGLALHLLFVLGGASAGLVLYASGQPLDPLPLAATLWSLGATLLAALIGAYVAARASGLRRLADGVLHGAVSWGATTLLLAVIGTTALAGTVGGLFGLVAPNARSLSGAGATPLAQVVIDALRTGDRASALRRLQEDHRLSEEDANRYLDLGAALADRAPRTRADAERDERAARAVAQASGWLAGAIGLSLIAGVVGGGIGARGARRLLKGPRFVVQEPATRPGGFAEPAG